MPGDWLRKEDYLEQGKDLSPGEQINIFHCREGKDNDRLYIRKTEDGTILAHCKHCGLKGYHKTKDFLLPHERKVEPVNKNNISIPRDIVYRLSEWHVLARLWIRKARVCQKDLDLFRIGYSPSLQRVILPLYLGDKLIGFQTRRIFSQDTLPKYLFYKKEKNYPYFLYLHNPNTTKITIVEDLLSGIRVWKFTSVIILFGTNIYDEAISICGDYADVDIFMDNDNPEVEMKQVNAKSILDLLVDNVRIIREEKDPKAMADDELRRVLL